MELKLRPVVSSQNPIHAANTGTGAPWAGPGAPAGLAFPLGSETKLHFSDGTDYRSSLLGPHTRGRNVSISSESWLGHAPTLTVCHSRLHHSSQVTCHPAVRRLGYERCVPTCVLHILLSPASGQPCSVYRALSSLSSGQFGPVRKLRLSLGTLDLGLLFRAQALSPCTQAL